MTYGHYVPQLHIRNFGINEKQTARFDKKTGQKLIVPIESFCGEDDYFAFNEENLTDLPWYLRWIDKNLIERNLAKYIEGPVSSILRLLITEKLLSALSQKQVLMLLEWMAWLFIANPKSIAIPSIASITHHFNTIDYTKLSKTERLKAFTDLHEQITPIFQKRRWILQTIEPHHGLLISSDRPVMIGGKSLQELPHLSSQTIIFPVSPQLALIGNTNPIWGYADKPLESTKEASLLMNILTYDQSYRFMFGANMNDLDNLFKTLKDTAQSHTNSNEKPI